MLSYETTRFNSNYAYFNLKQKTMPNGLGMGGQTGYFALWLDAEDYGRGKCAPSCSSFQSPQLSKEEDFQFTHLEVRVCRMTKHPPTIGELFFQLGIA